MAAASNNHARGVLVTAIGGVTLTVDIPLVRLSQGDPWSILLLRAGATLAATLVIWIIRKRLAPDAPPFVPGWTGAAVAALYGMGSVAFVLAVHNTSTANLVFILSFTTMFAALLSWLFLKQRPSNPTLVTIAVMISGVLIIVWDSIGAGRLFGDLAAFASTFFLSSAITLSRYSGKDMGFASLVGVVLPLLIAIVAVANVGYRVDAPWWIIFNGAVVMPVAFYCLATGPRFLSAPEVAMFYLLETIFAPIWVWLIFAEAPSTASLIGGTILIVALVSHSLWQLTEGRRRKAAGNLRHPV